MKKQLQLSILLFSFILLKLPVIFAQNPVEQYPPFEIHLEYPYISLSKKQLVTANTIQDLETSYNKLHLEYKPSWIEKYISVEIQVCQNGVVKTATGSSEEFTKAQKELLSGADPDKEIQINIHYWPKNNLVQNFPKTINFSLTIDPEVNASFPGGTDALRQYLKETSIGKMAADKFENYDLTAIKFKISPSGKVEQAAIFGAEYQHKKFESINQQLLATIREMPRWQPAAYADGTPFTQGFILTVGSQENCVLPLLNIGK